MRRGRSLTGVMLVLRTLYRYLLCDADKSNGSPARLHLLRLFETTLTTTMLLLQSLYTIELGAKVYPAWKVMWRCVRSAPG